MKTLALALLFAAGSWLGGWWMVPLLAFAAALLPWTRPVAPALAALAATLAWALILAWDAAGRFAAVTTALHGAMPLPIGALIVVTLVIPALLAWSAATLGSMVPIPRRD